jgi:hypothetical protein
MTRFIQQLHKFQFIYPPDCKKGHPVEGVLFGTGDRTRFAFCPFWGKIKVATSFLNWWLQMSTGHLHERLFDPGNLT